MKFLVFYRNPDTLSGSPDTSFVRKIFEQARSLSDKIPANIREDLAQLAAEINGGVEGVKKGPNPEAEKKMEELRDKSRSWRQKALREGATAELRNNAKYEKLLSQIEGFESLKAGDIMRLREKGENIAKYLITDTDGNGVNLDATNTLGYVGKILRLNFGNNESINSTIGLGDILPSNVAKVEIIDTNGKSRIGTLGTEDSRKGRKPRVGYYDESGKYIPVYRDYTIKIVSLVSVAPEAQAKYDELQSNFTKELRIREMADIFRSKNKSNRPEITEIESELKDLYQDSTDVALFGEVAKEVQKSYAKSEHIRESYKDAIGSRDKFIGRYGWYFRDVIAVEFPHIPAHYLINLFDKESNPRGKFDPNAGSLEQAYGLGQMFPLAWADAAKHANKKYDRTSPFDQIHAAAAYIDMIIDQNNCTLEDAIVYYHMGPNVHKRFILPNDLSALETYKAKNPAVAREMTENTWRGYMNAARRYYIEDTTLLSGIDLSGHGTVLSVQLGDYVMSTALPNTGDSSCGQAVGILLNRFGIENLPQSGRDGKNWDDILEPRVQDGQFKKVPIGHPDEASPGAILVYENGSELGSKMNKLHGHVEIKGSDGKYYSYYEGMRAGGSAANDEKDPIRYRELTSFTGFAYYPIRKSA